MNAPRSLVLLLSLVACTPVPADAYPPDAHAPDARAPDARPPAPPDATALRDTCMGNLPNSRTANVDDSDTVPSGLLNEIQDVIIAGNFKPGPMTIGGGAFRIQAGAPVVADHEWTFSTVVDATLCADLILPVGVTIEELYFDIKRNSANGNGTFRLQLIKYNMGAGTNVPIYDFLQSTGSPYAMIEIAQGASYAIQDNATYLLKILTDTTPAFDAAPKFDGVRMVLSR